MSVETVGSTGAKHWPGMAWQSQLCDDWVEPLAYAVRTLIGDCCHRHARPCHRLSNETRMRAELPLRVRNRDGDHV
jgi:hypothetical protein